MATPILALYTCKLSPYAVRVDISLAQAKADYKKYEVDLTVKPRPEWYTKHINPTGQAPSMTYGGPDVPLDQPSPESTKLRESVVLMEFVADLYPDSGLLPSDPVGRAKARFFVDVVNTQFAKPYVAHLHGEGPTMASVLPGLEAIQALLPADRPLALGSAFTMADAAVAPFLLHLEAVLKVRDTEEVGAALRSEKFARLAKYRETLREHPSVQSAWDEAYIAQYVAKVLG